MKKYNKVHLQGKVGWLEPMTFPPVGMLKALIDDADNGDLSAAQDLYRYWLLCTPKNPTDPEHIEASKLLEWAVKEMTEDGEIQQD